ncbi:MAG: hypothetical protein MMC23_008834 [Stictis urceolatum]|nr:hypothetical protein [Stictis urceolata]
MRHASASEQSEMPRQDEYQSVSRDAANPVVYVPVPRSRQGLSTAGEAGKPQLEIMEQILGSLKQALLRLYFRFIHPNFPVIDRVTSNKALRGDATNLPPTLMCVLYAISLQSWHKSEQLRLHPCPDAHYAWNQAVAAFHEDFKTPSMITVTSGVIDLIGRPSVSLVGNITNCARTVALAQTLGLHRDPSAWLLPDDEKDMRIRLFWGVLINDVWSSIAYGIPPKMAPGSYDTPLLKFGSLSSMCDGNLQEPSSLSYIHLCSLTQILGDALPSVYQLNPDPALIAMEANRLQIGLRDWEIALSGTITSQADEGQNITKPRNLWFSFLFAKLVLRHLLLRATIKGKIGTDSESQSRAACLDQLRTAASDVVDFVSGLSENDLNGFWLPYTSHLLVSATMILLRCIVEGAADKSRSTHVSKLVTLKERLELFRDRYHWDLGDFCLERCSGPIMKFAKAPEQGAYSTEQSGTVPVIDSPLPEAHSGSWIEQDFSSMFDTTDDFWDSWSF